MKKYRPLLPYLTTAGALILVAIFAQRLTPFDPYAQDLEGALTPPNSTNLLGTDRYGRDVLSRVIVGSRFKLAKSAINRGNIFCTVKIFSRTKSTLTNALANPNAESASSIAP